MSDNEIIRHQQFCQLKEVIRQGKFILLIKHSQNNELH